MNAHAPIPIALIPQDVEMEQAVLGACIGRKEVIDAVMGVVCPEDFYHSPHHLIAEAIFDLHRDGQPVTPLTVGARMAGQPGFEEIGGRVYLAGMAIAAPGGGILSLARGLSDLQLRRHAIEAATMTQEALRDPGQGIASAMRPVLEAADHAALKTGKRDFVPVRQAADEMLQEAEDRAGGKPVVMATTGLNILDEAVGGLQAGDLGVFAGRPGMGKSALLMTSALRTAMTGRPVIFFSLEMTMKRLLERIGADLDFDANPANPISYSWFRNGSAKGPDIARMAEALRNLPETLSIFDQGGMTIQEIAAHARSAAARSHSMGLVVIDYLQKVQAGDRYAGNKVQEVTEISGGAKALAMRLKWPVLVGAQLNRGVESREEKRPSLTDLRESGAIEQDADIVVGLYRPGYYIGKRKPALGPSDPSWAAWEADWEIEKNRLDLLVMKNRNGAEDCLSVFCDMRASAIRDEKPMGVR